MILEKSAYAIESITNDYFVLLQELQQLFNDKVIVSAYVERTRISLNIREYEDNKIVEVIKNENFLFLVDSIIIEGEKEFKDLIVIKQPYVIICTNLKIFNNTGEPLYQADIYTNVIENRDYKLILAEQEI